MKDAAERQKRFTYIHTYTHLHKHIYIHNQTHDEVFLDLVPTSLVICSARAGYEKIYAAIITGFTAMTSLEKQRMTHLDLKNTK